MRRAVLVLVTVISAALAGAGCSGSSPGGTSRPVAETTAAAGSGALSITSPANGATVATASVTVIGTAPAGARVVRDISLAPDDETTADASGRWRIAVNLDEGSNELTFRIGDDKSTAVTITVTYSPTGPAATDTPVVEEPTPEPTPEVTENPFAFQPVTLKGKGSKVAKFSIPDGVPAIASFSEKSTSNFVVYSLAADGSENDLLVNEIGNYTGTVLFDSGSGQHSVAFKIESNGSWTITIKPITAAATWDAASVAKGTGSNVLLVTGDVSGLFTVKITHKGSANFVVYAWTASDRDLLVNEIGSYSGETTLPDGTLLIEVLADGTWTITPQ